MQLIRWGLWYGLKLATSHVVSGASLEVLQGRPSSTAVSARLGIIW